MYGKLWITRFFWHLAIFGQLFCCRLMNIFLTQFCTVKLLIHKPQPRLNHGKINLGTPLCNESRLQCKHCCYLQSYKIGGIQEFVTFFLRTFFSFNSFNTSCISSYFVSVGSYTEKISTQCSLNISVTKIYYIYIFNSLCNLFAQLSEFRRPTQ